MSFNNHNRTHVCTIDLSHMIRIEPCIKCVISRVVGVPAYRVSQMTNYGGNILSAYGFVDVVSPCGVPIRSIVGISPDPIMFVALNCADVKKNRQYYEALGFTEQVREMYVSVFHALPSITYCMKLTFPLTYNEGISVRAPIQGSWPI